MQASPTPPMPLVAPLFVEDAQLTSTIVLVNASSSPVSAEVALRSLGGAVIAHRSVTIPGANRVDLAIGPMLQSVGSAETSGSVVIASNAKSIAAALSLTDHAETTPSYVDEELSMPMATSSPMLRAIADRSKASPIVAITSLTSTVQYVTITCLREQGRSFTKVAELPPNGTVITRSCDAATNSSGDFESVALSADGSSSGAFGIELSSDGPAGGFAAFGLAQHRSGDDQYFSTVPFEDPMMMKSSTTVFTGVPVGRASLLPSANYTPLLALANFGAQTANVTVTLATTQNGDPASATVGTIQVAPGQSKLLKLDGLTGNEQMLNSFTVKSDRGPGQVVVKLAAISDGALHEVEMLAKDAQNGHNGGVHPWSIAEGNESTLLLFNDSSETQAVHVAIGYASGKAWKKNFTLKPLETAAINIGDLIRSQVKDDHGNPLPATLTEGDVLWSAQANALQGRLLQSDPATATARSFSCYAWYFICGSSIDGPTTVNVGDTFSEDASTYDSCVDTDEMNECFDDYEEYVNLDLSYYWTVGNSSILQSNSGYAANPFSLTAIGAGQSDLNVSVSDGYCSVDDGETITAKPKISSISPAQGLIGTTVSITINGQGLGHSPSVNAGSGITVSINSASNTQIQATFNISTSATGGNHAVAVTVGGQTSSSANFYVQIPSKLTFANYESLVTITNGSVLDYFGNVLLTGECGGYRNIADNLLDQAGAAILGGPFTFTENFSNYSTTVSGLTVPPGQSSTQNTAIQALADTQFFGTRAPSCPGPNDHESFDQSFVLTIGSTNYPLSTVFHIERGNYSGTFHVDETVKVP